MPISDYGCFISSRISSPFLFREGFSAAIQFTILWSNWVRASLLSLTLLACNFAFSIAIYFCFVLKINNLLRLQRLQEQTRFLDALIVNCENIERCDKQFFFFLRIAVAYDNGKKKPNCSVERNKEAKLSRKPFSWLSVGFLRSNPSWW